MMKRAVMIGLVLMLILNVSACLGEAEAQYTALAIREFHLRDVPDGQWVEAVPQGSRIQVLDWGEEWCFAAYKDAVGYCKTAWLYCLRSLNALVYPVHNNPCDTTGYLVMKQDTVVKAGNFAGTTVAAESVVCARLTDDGSMELCVWRDKQALAADAAVYHAFVDWETAAIGDIIGGFTTYYCDKQGKNHPEERENNIRLACSRIDGLMLTCGGRFSFNELCGPYKKSNGYLLAPNISKQGEGYGGGVCQLSTTLYNALLTLPLQIEEWNIHRFSGVPYIPQFCDAAVGTYTDLIFFNTLPYPIRLQASAENGVVNVFIVRAE